MIMLELDPISKASVLWPPWVSPAESSIVMSVMVRPSHPLMLTAWTGVFRMCRLVMDDDEVRPCAAKNLGFVLPPLPP
jgi:hypothetical protein